MSNSNASNNMKKQSWRIFKKKKAILNSCMGIAVSATMLMLAGNASAQAIPAGALPTGGEFVGGTGTIGTNGSTMNINQSSQYGVVNFDGFNVGQQAAVNVLNGAGATLGRVVGAGVSVIDGTMQATGSLFLINRNGVVVGKTGQITTGGAFGIATTDVDTNKFMQSGAFNPAGNGMAPIANLGSIKAGSNVTLYGSEVVNAGSIEAKNGKVSVTAQGDSSKEKLKAMLGDSEYEKFYVESGKIANSGSIEAAQVDLEARGGNVFSYAINNSGRIRATGVETAPDGKVTLSTNGDIKVSGEIAAKNADGSGGQAYIGGGYQGKDASIQNAANTTITSTAKIDVSGSGNKDGGKAIVWSENKTSVAGTVNATSGATGGKGGFVELSGKNKLVLDETNVKVSTKGVNGGGQLLLDPKNIKIVDAAVGAQPANDSDTTYFSDAFIETLLDSNAVTLQTSAYSGTAAGDIDIENGVSITWSNDFSSLELVADRDINVKGVDINGGESTNGKVVFRAARDINFSGDNVIESGSNGATYLYAAGNAAEGGNWQNGLGTINFATTGSNEFIGRSFYLTSGKKADGTRVDLSDATNADFGTESTFSTIDLRGFNTVDFGSGSDDPLVAGNYVKIYAKNINLNSDLDLGGSLHLVAAAFDANNNYSVNSSEALKNSDLAGESNGWLNNIGELNFTKGSITNITSCCELVLHTGKDAATGDAGRTNLLASDVKFTHKNTPGLANGDKYSVVDISGFNTYQTNFVNNTMDPADVNTLLASDFVKIRNFTNIIDNNIIVIDEGTNPVSTDALIYSFEDTVIRNAAIGANNVAIVVDDTTPTSAGQYGLLIDANSEIVGNNVAIYSSTQGQTVINGKINNSNFVKGVEFTNNTNETWTGFYKTDTGNTFSTGNAKNPFMVYYKNTQPPATVTGQSDCQINPSAPGCENFVNLINDRVEYRIARSTLGSRVEQAVKNGEYLAASNSGMNLPTETFTKTGGTYMDDKLYTLTEKLGTAAYAIPAEIVSNVVEGTIGAIPGIQGVVDKANFQAVPGAIAEVARIPSTFLVETGTILTNIFGGTLGAVGNVIGGTAGAIGGVFSPSTPSNPVVSN